LPLLLITSKRFLLDEGRAMKLLLIHSDIIEYEVKSKAIKSAEPIPEELKKESLENALTVFIAVEKKDEKSTKNVIEKAKNEIIKTANTVDVKNIMLYPYAHLSSDLSSPKNAIKILADLEDTIKEEGFNVKRAPFGWYKSFKLSCKGHPLSELSREITPEVEETAVEKEKKVVSRWYILTPEGKLIDAEKFNFTNFEDLKIFYEYESSGSRLAKGEPPHVKLMRSMELVDYEPSSDSGNFRWYPKGKLIKGLLEEYVTRICRSNGAMQVETPIMYDLDHEALGAYVKKFPARQYIVRSDEKEFFLRFAACFGQYMIAHDMNISYRDLPLRLYELTHYSFRREQSGELSGLKRLRCFTMPDMHTLCADINQAKEEFKRQFKLSMQWMNALGLDYEVAIRFVKDFYEKNKDLALELVKTVNKPVLIELWDERYFYFVMKFEFNIIDSLKKASALSTVQIDVENAERFNITYVDENGKKRYPLILHTSISGSIDRCLYAILEREAIRMSKGGKGRLPLWLSPTQIRLIPVKNDFIKECEEIIKDIRKLNKNKGVIIRVDIDDRDESVSKKIRDAEKEWVPVIIVIGEEEKKKKSLKPRFRDETIAKKAGRDSLTIEELNNIIVEEIRQYPQSDLPLPKLLSIRPKFRG
jgi:threonyl-tRNA synthetase